MTSLCGNQINKKIEKKLLKAAHSLNNYAKKWGLKLKDKQTTYIGVAINHKRKSYIFNANLKLKLNHNLNKKDINPILLGITFDICLQYITLFYHSC